VCGDAAGEPIALITPGMGSSFNGNSKIEEANPRASLFQEGVKGEREEVTKKDKPERSSPSKAPWRGSQKNRSGRSYRYSGKGGIDLYLHRRIQTLREVKEKG